MSESLYQVCYQKPILLANISVTAIGSSIGTAINAASSVIFRCTYLQTGEHGSTMTPARAGGLVIMLYADAQAFSPPRSWTWLPSPPTVVALPSRVRTHIHIHGRAQLLYYISVSLYGFLVNFSKYAGGLAKACGDAHYGPPSLSQARTTLTSPVRTLVAI